MSTLPERSIQNILSYVPADLKDSFVHFLATAELNSDLEKRAEEDTVLQYLMDEALQCGVDEIFAILVDLTSRMSEEDLEHLRHILAQRR